MAKVAPTPVDVLDFQFKLKCRLKVFQNEANETFNKPCNIVATASRYGLLFLGSGSSHFQVIQVVDLEKYTIKDGEISNYNRRNVSLPSKPLHLGVNCDSTMLSVVCEINGCIKAFIYDILSFLRQEITIKQEIRLSPTPNVNILEVTWNPTITTIFTACKSDGSLGLYELKESGFEIIELPSTTGALSMCWSPKGKQIAVGGTDGKITQYKPDLKIAKVINPPPLEGKQSVVALQWISNYQFIAVYKLPDLEAVSSLLVVDAPKSGEVSYTNYDDVCYSYGIARPQQFYMLLQSTWNILMVASSNSMEVGVLGLEKDCWIQWILSDSARAELPLSPSKQDTLPVGLALNISSTQAIPWGETTLPPTPYLLLLSNHGVLCCFSVINIKQGSSAICQVPEQISDKSGLIYFYTKEPNSITKLIEPGKEIVQNSTQSVISLPTKFSFNPSGGLTINKTAAVNVITQSTTANTTKSIFGSSVSITKVSPIPATAPLPSFGTITSINASQVPTTENLNIQTTLVNKPVLASELSVSTSEKSKNVPLVEQMTPLKNSLSQISEINILNEDTEALIAQMVKDECLTMETELKVMLHKGYSLEINLGNDNEATEMVESTNCFQKFIDEVTETSSCQAAEIHSLKQTLMHMWVWYEEARSRYTTFKDPKLIALMRLQPLDPASERHLNEIRHLSFYLESQLNQANIALDEQWEAFQDSCRKKISYRISTIEAIYQSMVKQNATLQRQTYMLKDISTRMRSRNHTNQVPHLLVSLDNADKLEEQLRNLQLEPKDLFQLQHQRILDRQKLLSKGKADKLKKLLLKRQIVHVSVTKPQLSNSTLQLNSLIGAPLSPIVPSKKLHAQKNDFIQSTPKLEALSQKGIAKSGNFQFLEPTKTESLPLISPSILKTPHMSNIQYNQENTTYNVNKAAPLEFINSSTENEVVTKPFSFSTLNNIINEVKTSPGSAFVPTTQNITFGVKNNVFGSTTPSMTKITTNEQKPMFSLDTTVSDSSLSVISKTMPSSSAVDIFPTLTSSTSPQKPTLFSTKPPVAAVPTVTFSFIAPTTLAPTFGRFTFSLPQNNTTPTTLLKSTISFSTPSTQSSVKVINQDKNKSSVQYLSSNEPGDILTTSSAKSIFSSPVNSTQSSPFSTSGSLFTLSSTSKTSSVFEPPVSATQPSKSTSIFTMVPTTQIKMSFTSPSTMPSKSVFGSVPSLIQTSPISSLASSEHLSSVTINQPPLSLSSISNTPPFTSLDNKISETAICSGVSVAGTQSSIFGSNTSPIDAATPNVSKTSGFGIPVVSNVIFSAPTANNSIFSTPVTTSILEQRVTYAPIFTDSAASVVKSSVSSTTVQSTLSTSSPSSTPATFIETPLTTTSAIAISSPVFLTSAVTTSIPSTTTTMSVTSPVSSVFGLPMNSSTGFASPSVFGTVSNSPPSYGTSTISTTSFETSLNPTVLKTPSSTTGFGINNSVFGIPSTSNSVFGIPSSNTTIFGQPSMTTTIFGAPTSSATVFGQTSTVFGAVPTTTKSIFDTPTSQTSIFGNPATTSTNVFSSNNSAFGTPKTAASVFSTGSIFGTNTTSSTFGTGFGTTSSAPAFGQASTFGSIFSTPSTTSSGNIFGGKTGNASNVFGNTTTSSVFGTPTSSAPFGGQSSVFGEPATGTSGFGTTSSSFGSKQANSFSFTTGADAANVSSSGGTNFGFNKPSYGSFGSNTNVQDASSFSFGGLNVGSPTTTTSAFGSGFVQNQNPFGRPSGQEQKSIFGDGNVFGTPASTSSSVFGGSAPFNKPSPSFGAPATFGSSSGFGQQSPPQSFGQGGFGNSIFGSPSQSPGPFSGGSQSIAQSGFGASPVFQKSSGFGSPPAFGSTSGGFGSPPAFGNTSAFSATPSFGTPNKVFGGGAQAADTFGSTGQQNSTFANLANQTTLGFGSLAQQNQTPTSTFSGGSSFSSWR